MFACLRIATASALSTVVALALLPGVSDAPASVASASVAPASVTAADPVQEATLAIEARYQALGGPTGVLGAPKSAVTPLTGGYVRRYTQGNIYYSTATGAWDLRAGPLNYRYVQLGAERSQLGLPTSSQVAAGRPGALVQTFRGGRIYWSSATGGRDVYGASLARYLQLGGAPGVMGLPTTGERAGTRPGVRVTAFQSGRIWYTPATGAREVRGLTLKKYLAIGAESSWIGLPIGYYGSTGYGGRQAFQKAALQYYVSRKIVYIRVPFTTSVTTPTAAQLPYTYRSGCPVKPSGLRMVRLPFRNWALDDQYGTIVVRASVVSKVAAAFKAAHDTGWGWAFRRVVSVDAYKGSDQASMRADNTSAFNCRKVTGNPYRLSQHSYGNAIDINPFENPYVTATKVYPEGSGTYLNRNNYRKGMLRRGDPVESTFRRYGWPWGARWRYPDYQHFSENGA